MGGSVAVGAGLSEAGDRRIDQTGIDRGHRLITQPQPLHGAGPKPFQQDVGRSDEIPEPLLVAVRLEIERHRALVAIERGVERRKLPRGISDARTLDEDDVGPKIGHQKRRVGPGILLSQADNTNTLELQHDDVSSPDMQSLSLQILFVGL